MSRPVSDTDRRLLQAGRKLVYKTGLTGLSIRQVARQAGVNLGMFHYHFKSKDRFGRAILQEIYEDFFKQFTVETSLQGSPLDRLRRALTMLGRFSRDNRALWVALLTDVLSGNKPTIQFIRENFLRHISVVAGLIEDCQKKGLVRKMPVPLAISFVAPAVGLSHLVIEIMSRSHAKATIGGPFSVVEPMLLSDQAVSERVEMALRGITV